MHNYHSHCEIIAAGCGSVFFLSQRGLKENNTVGNVYLWKMCSYQEPYCEVIIPPPWNELKHLPLSVSEKQQQLQLFYAQQHSSHHKHKFFCFTASFYSRRRRG